ncbi:MAG: hypothetical protein ACKON7_03915 [Planctomycetaceae bacterium]
MRPYLHKHLLVGDRAVLDVASGFQHLEPPHPAVVDRSLGDGRNGLFDAEMSSADEFDHRGDVFAHG